MRVKLLSSILFLILLSWINGTEAQSLVVRLTDGSETSQYLSTVNKLSFSDGSLMVDFNSGTTDTYYLSEVQKLYFDSNVSVSELSSNPGQTLKVYPNPAGEYVLISNIPGQAGKIRIYNVEGRLVIERTITGAEMSVDVSTLSKGLYFISTEGLSSKFIKQ